MVEVRFNIIEFKAQEFKQVDTIKKKVTEDKPIIIGREKGCDIRLSLDCISRQHGKIMLSKGNLMYSDTSSNGSTLLRFLDKQTKHTSLNNRPAVLKSLDWIFLSRAGLYGYIIIPMF